MKVLYLTIVIIVFIAGSNVAFSQSPDGLIQNTTSQAFFNCTDTMEQNMKTKLMSFDQERAKTAAINYDKFQSEVKGDEYTFHAISEEWTNDQAKCDATLKSVLVLFNVFDESGKQRDVTVLVDPVSYQPQSIDVVNEIVKHGGIRILPPLQTGSVQTSQSITNKILSPLKQFKSGVAANDVICKPDMQLLIKNQENRPICVKLNHVSNLLRRDWSYPANCNYVHDSFTAGVAGLVIIEKNASDPSSGKSYSPQNSTVVIGWNNTVSWINQDLAPSSVTSNWNLFDSGPILPESEWKHTFECAGNYGYHSEPHLWMKGWIRVLPPSG